MDIKFIWTFLLILQYGSCLDEKNCTKLTETVTTLPANPSMKFYIFTNKNFFSEQEVFIGDKSSLLNSNFNPQWPVRIIVHGWRNNLMSCINGHIKDAYLKKGNFNVFIVDWGNWAQNFNYLAVAQSLFKSLGPLLAKFINFLNEQGNIEYDNIYLIGHSLGAHLCGSAGKYIQPNQVNTIFGLDPAGPSFQGKTANDRLDKSHAKYVEQISTNMGILGYTGLIGHAGFYPNYGRVQRNCVLYNQEIGCSHGLAHIYFAESINTLIGFCSQYCPLGNILIGLGCPSLKCPNGQQILMGGEPSIPKTDTYYLKTNDNKTFAQCNC